jgi:hypothetical protein
MATRIINGTDGPVRLQDAAERDLADYFVVDQATLAQEWQPALALDGNDAAVVDVPKGAIVRAGSSSRRTHPGSTRADPRRRFDVRDDEARPRIDRARKFAISTKMHDRALPTNHDNGATHASHDHRPPR